MKISQDFKEHISHYLVLLLLLDLSIAAFFLFSFERLYQAMVVIVMGICYVVWGVIHHHLSEDLHLKVVLEYLLIASLAIMLILALLFRA